MHLYEDIYLQCHMLHLQVNYGFGCCTDGVKLTLFKAYCTHLYTAHVMVLGPLHLRCASSGHMMTWLSVAEVASPCELMSEECSVAETLSSTSRVTQWYNGQHCLLSAGLKSILGDWRLSRTLALC